MSNKDRNYSKDVHERNSLPQYGKKGHKPRVPDYRRNISLDDITTNDISYWNKTSGFDNVSKFNWDLIVGNPRSISGVLPTQFSGISGTLNPPQVMVLNTVMGPGWANSVEDGVNRSLAQLMAKIRANLSTSNIGFETADLGIMLASTSSIAAMIGLAKRVLECYNVWKDRNYVYPRALIKAQGFDYYDIMKNINKYSMQLNSSIDMYNNMSLLDCFDIYDRQYSMCHNIFADEDSQFGQLYMFFPNNYYVYDDTNRPAKAKSHEFVRFNNAPFYALLDIIEDMIQGWYGSSDLYQINGTMLRAFKDAPRQHIPHHVVEDVISPVVDRAFLMQIMNCTIVPVDHTALDMTQDPFTQNYIIWKPKKPSVAALNTINFDKTVLRLFENDITLEDNMELTRLMNFVDTGPTFTDYYVRCGSEIVTSIRSYSYNAQFDAESYDEINSNYINISPNDLSNVLSMNAIRALQSYRYIPCIHLILTKTDSSKIYYGFIGDVYNWMVYTQVDWLQLQFVAYQSLWTPKNGI